jgi:DNA-binding NarL/FixJ family response regulator
MIRCMTASVLVVDDDPEFRALARRLLAADGLIVIGEADRVSAALAAAGRLRPSAILVDAELPGGDGIALARELAALPWHPRVVVTSVDGGIATADNRRRAGAAGFVRKVDLADAPLAEWFGGA